MMHNTEIPYILDVENLGKQFQLHLVDGRVITPFANVSFKVRQGHLFMISGKSGAGKTTILKCIYRTYLTNQGHIWYDSREFGRIDIASADENSISRLR